MSEDPKKKRQKQTWLFCLIRSKSISLLTSLTSIWQLDTAVNMSDHIIDCQIDCANGTRIKYEKQFPNLAKVPHVFTCSQNGSIQHESN